MTRKMLTDCNPCLLKKDGGKMLVLMPAMLIAREVK